MFLSVSSLLTPDFKWRDYSQEEETLKIILKMCVTIIQTFFLWFFEMRDEDMA